MPLANPGIQNKAATEMFRSKGLPMPAVNIRNNAPVPNRGGGLAPPGMGAPPMPSMSDGGDIEAQIDQHPKWQKFVQEMIPIAQKIRSQIGQELSGGGLGGAPSGIGGSPPIGRPGGIGGGLPQPGGLGRF